MFAFSDQPIQQAGLKEETEKKSTFGEHVRRLVMSTSCELHHIGNRFSQIRVFGSFLDQLQ